MAPPSPSGDAVLTIEALRQRGQVLHGSGPRALSRSTTHEAIMDHQAGQRPFMVCQTGDDLHLHTLVFAASPTAAAITASVALALRSQVAHDRAITLQIEPKGMPLHQLVDFCRRVEFIGHCDQEHGSCP